MLGMTAYARISDALIPAAATSASTRTPSRTPPAASAVCRTLSSKSQASSASRAP